MKKIYHAPVIETKIFESLHEVMIEFPTDSGIHDDPAADSELMDENGIIK